MREEGLATAATLRQDQMKCKCKSDVHQDSSNNLSSQKRNASAHERKIKKTQWSSRKATTEPSKTWKGREAWIRKNIYIYIIYI